MLIFSSSSGGGDLRRKMNPYESVLNEVIDKLCKKSWQKYVGNEGKTRFWEDLWVGGMPLKEKFLRIYNISLLKGCLTSECGVSLGIDDKTAWNFGEDEMCTTKSFINEVGGRELGKPIMKHVFDNVWQ
ncbi:hypothetical protein PIB30_075519 [Stylosanthes scabra]|uniref:Uncharacterized protein n=1 Tax=Stylosanthes scabra TaxID=79078 RepID=A0ABU6YNY5_9FABA|nr:hypothetical protein [Stylosanthes scabra]